MVKIEPYDELDTTQKTKTELIRFKQNYEVHYQGYCKLLINRLSKLLLVEPLNENFINITGFSAPFNWKFIKQKNILFAFGEFEYDDFALIFDEEKTCRKVYYGIYKDRSKDFVPRKLFLQRMLNPIFKKVAQNSRLKEIMEEWIEKHDGKEKEKYLEVFKWYRENPEFGDYEENDVKNVKPEIEKLPNKSRKRRYCEIGGNNLSDTVNVLDHGNFEGLNDCNADEFYEHPTTQMKNLSSYNLFAKIDHSNFKIGKLKSGKKNRRKLLIFTSPDKTQCYEFSFYRKKQFFNHCCRENFNGIKAIFDIDENGKECIKMEDKKHRCSPILYEPEKYFDMKIIKKPDYEILGNCATKSRRLLIIFNSNDRNQCYEYSWRLKEKIFCCRGCGMKGKSWSSAEILHENTETEYVILSTKEHSCEMRKYNPEKYFSSNDIVLSPNFEIQKKIKNGTERKTLIIFDENDRKLCYSYFWWNHGNRYICSGCCRKHKIVSAKICKNDENEEYVILSNVKHDCSPRNYVAQNKIISLHPPKFKIIEATEKCVSKLLIFDSTDPTLCYTFSQHRNVYHCLGCITAQYNMNVDGNKFRQSKKVVTAFLGKDDGPNGEYFVKFNDGEKHNCEPKRYEPEKYDLKILKPKIDYILFREKSKSKYFNLLTYHPEDEKLCYKYSYLKSKNIFQCPACRKLSTLVSARLHQNSDGTEYLTTSKKEHICSPKKRSSIISSNTEILEKSGLDFKESKKKEIDETRIVRRPNFELQQNSRGVPERRLIVFCDEERKYCYDYGYRQLRDRFLCKICSTSAKINVDEENGNEKYVILGETKHKCDPVKYEPEKEFVEKKKEEEVESRKTIFDNFVIHFNDSGVPDSRLTVLNGDDNSFGYRYYFFESQNLFSCMGCTTKKKQSSAKLITDKDGNQPIRFGKIEHVCAIRNLKKEKLFFSDFKFEENRKFLITYDPTQKNRFYKFAYDEKLGTFCCVKCLERKKKYITATICKENDEKEFVLLNVPHLCVSVLK